MSVEGIQVGMCFTGAELFDVADINILHPDCILACSEYIPNVSVQILILVTVM